MTWDEVLEREDLVGGDIEAHEREEVYRGPIKDIRRVGDTVVIENDWVAVTEDQGASWTVSRGIKQMSLNVRHVPSPQDIGEGRITFTPPMMGPVVIFPRGGSKLDPAKVRGLTI